MAGYVTVVCLSVIILNNGLISGQFDPCSRNSHNILDDSRRKPSYRAQDSEQGLCDKDLSKAWYRFQINGTDAEMPSQCVQKNACGTSGPIWLRSPSEGLPVPGQESEGRGCITWSTTGEAQCCYFGWPIKIRNCKNNFFVYQLQSTYACDLAYCAFVPDTVCEVGQIYIRHLRSCIDYIVEVTKPILQIQKRGNKMVLSCSFDIPNDVIAMTSPTFHTQWYRGDRASISIVRSTFLRGTEDSVVIDENVFPGETITCGVQSVSGGAGEVVSDSYFLGIKVLEDNFVIEEEDNYHTLTLVNKLPITCSNTRSCDPQLLLQTTSIDGLAEPKILLSTCKISLVSTKVCPRNICEEKRIRARLAPNLRNFGLKSFELVGDLFVGGDIWRMTLNDTTINTRDRQSAVCYGVSGVQILTFSDRIKVIEKPGTYVLFKNGGRRFVIHFRVRRCVTGTGLCICGIVIKYKGTIVLIDTCQSTGGSYFVTDFRIKTRGSVSSDIQMFQGRNGKLIHALFNNEGRLRIDVTSGYMVFGLSISGFYTGKVNGVCGKFLQSSDEFNSIPGTSKTWRLAPGRSYFDRYPDLTASQESGINCDCTKSSIDNPCPIYDMTESVMNPLLAMNDVTTDWLKRSRDMIGPPRYRFDGDFDNDDSNGNNLPDTDRNTAKDECEKFIFNSDIAKKCADHVSVKIHIIIEMCVRLALTQAPSLWKSIILRLSENVCESMVEAQPTGDSSDTSRKDYENTSLCPQKCFGRGRCTGNGCVCDYGFQGIECLEDGPTTTTSTTTTTTIPTTTQEPTTTPPSTTTTTTTLPTTTTTTMQPTTTWTQPTTTTPATTTTTTVLTTTTTTTTTKQPTTTSMTTVPTTTTMTTTTSTVRPTTTTTSPTTTTSLTTTTITTTVPTTTTTTTVPTTTTTMQPTTTTTQPTTSTTQPTTTTTQPTTTTTQPTTTTTQPTTTTTIQPTTTTSQPTTTTQPTTATPHPTTTTTKQPTTTTTTPLTTTTVPTTTTTTTTTTEPTTTTTTTTEPTTTTTTTTEATTTLKTTTSTKRTTTTTELPTTTPKATARPVVELPFESCDRRNSSCSSVLVNLKNTNVNFGIGCWLEAVQFRDNTWYPVQSEERTTMRYVNGTMVQCLLPEDDSNADFTVYKIRVSDPRGFSLHKLFASVDGVCQICTKQNGCSFKRNTCYIEKTCYIHRHMNSANHCLQCDAELDSTTWSKRLDKQALKISPSNSNFSVIEGDTLFTTVNSSHSDGAVMKYKLDRQDARVSRRGRFKWRSKAVAVNGSTEVFRITISDNCGASRTLLLSMVVYKCPCKNSGTCVTRTVNYNRTSASSECNCRAGFTGKRCETYASACKSNPCFQGVNCLDEGDKYQCGQCPHGMMGDGRRCSSMTGCASQPCYQGVACRDTLTPPGYKCGECPRGFYGDGTHCKRNETAICRRRCSPLVQCEDLTSYPWYRCGPCPVGYYGDGKQCLAACNKTCSRNRVCVAPGVCRCRPHYTGFICHKPLCSPPCKNMGICYGVDMCRCRPGYSGPRCETALCTPPCSNGGRCVRRNQCSCPPGFAGSRCEVPICDIPCQHGGVCLPGQSCRCNANYHGDRCEKPRCMPNCRNGGTCIRPGYCRCPSQYYGPRCERALCYHGCLNGGVCIGRNICKCRNGYHGHRCQYERCRIRCLNGGRCTGRRRCQCQNGWRGRYCHRVKCKPGCKGRGSCVAPNTCKCRPGYYGSNCQYARCWPRCSPGQRCVLPNICRCRKTSRGRLCRCSNRGYAIRRLTVSNTRTHRQMSSVRIQPPTYHSYSQRLHWIKPGG